MKMKFGNVLLGASLLFAGVGTTPVLADQFQPEHGIRCDKSTQVCYENGQPNEESTRRYFGRDAARQVQRDMRRQAEDRSEYDRRDGRDWRDERDRRDRRDERDERIFHPERGVRCDKSARVCYERGEPSIKMTRRYFDRRAADRLERDTRREPRNRDGRIFYPERGVRCDRSEQVCYNRRDEPSVDLTRRYLGSDAARRLARRDPYYRR